MSGERSGPLGPTGQALRLGTRKAGPRSGPCPGTVGALWVSSPVHTSRGRHLGTMAVVRGGERAGAGAREEAGSLAGSPAVTQAGWQ